ncbi:MAG: prepilin-type N-terminal cleavage/methylation domain-containing protein [Deltaproteobacteria bacterium]|nr:prepilin-type N-terminal cleavage/methylation domain-containing protein [Deltaproteobacteria bacterium]
MNAPVRRSPSSRAANPATDPRGFTIIEVMAAVVILSIALLSLLRANSQSVLLRASSQEITTATLLAQERLAALRIETDEIEEESEGDFGEAFPHWRWTMEMEEVEVPFDFTALETPKTVSSESEATGSAGTGGNKAGGGAALAGGGKESEPTPMQKLTLTVFWPAGVREGSLSFTEYLSIPAEETDAPPSVGAPAPAAPGPPAGGGE